jgi:hypothetical protein
MEAAATNMSSDRNTGETNVYMYSDVQSARLPFGQEVKPEVPCRKILWYGKDLLKSHGDG